MVSRLRAKMHRSSTTSANLIKGAIAGVVATAVLDQVTKYLYAHESRSARARENRARSGKTAYETAAEKLAGLFGTRLNKEQRQRLGIVIHWTLGIVAGVTYATYGRKRASLRRGFGTGFGTTFWAAVDEGAVSLLGLTPPPRAFPAAAHLRGLAGHLAFGVAADRTLRVLDAIA